MLVLLSVAHQVYHLYNINIVKLLLYIAAIINDVSDTVVLEGQQANLFCKVSVMSNETIGFMIDNNVIDTSHSNCVDTFETATRKCSNTYDNFNITLICDYSVSYEVDCTLQVNGAPASACASNTVHCIVGDILSVGDRLKVPCKYQICKYVCAIYTAP